METIIRITTDYQSTGAYDEYVEDVTNLVNESNIKVKCVVRNTDYRNVVEDVKNYSDPDTFKNSVSFDATGYVQAQWQTFTLYYNCKDDNKYLKALIAELKKCFTHMNDYWVEKFERTTIDGKDFDAHPHDHKGFSMRDIEFPEEDEVLSRYNEIYGKDYDKAIVQIN